MILIADIGGSNARFALTAASAANLQQDIPKIEQIKTFRCADYQNIDAAMSLYLESLDSEDYPQAACFAVASSLHSKKISFTNNNWIFETTALEDKFNFRHLKLINDFEAIAYATPFLPEAERLSVQSPKPVIFDSNSRRQYALLGPGTGLGVAGLKADNGKFINIITEGGHASFAPVDKLEEALLRILKKQYSRVSNERLISGPGILAIYRALAEIYREEPISTSSSSIICQGAVENTDALCVKTFQLFCRILGAVAGDTALTLGATGGVLLAGGVLPKYVDFLQRSDFRKSFENKGRYKDYMQQIPTEVIVCDYPGLMGCAVCHAQGNSG